MIKHVQKKICLLLSFALLLSMVVIPTARPVTVQADSQLPVLYSTDFSDQLKDKFTQSGGASLTVVSRPADLEFASGGAAFASGSALLVSGRAYDYSAADITVDTLSSLGATVGSTYHVVVHGYVGAGATVPADSKAVFQMTNTSDINNWKSNVNIAAGQMFTLESDIEYDGVLRMRFQTNGAGASVPFYLLDVTITTVSEADQGTLVYKMTEDPEVIAGNISSQDMTRFVNAGAALSLASNANGGNAILVTRTAGNDNWRGIDIKSGTIPLLSGTEYDYTVTGRVPGAVPAGMRIELGLAVSPYTSIAGADVQSDGSFTLTGTKTLDPMANIRINTNAAGGGINFIVDEIEIFGIGDVNKPYPAGEVKPGLYINNTISGGSWSGVIIVTGTDENQWPFAKPTSSGLVAFAPEAGQKYRLTSTITSTGAAGIRVRWVKDATGGNDSYTAGDAAVVNNHKKPADQTATVIPAYFENTLSSGDTKVLVTEFVMDGSAVAGGLIGNITIRGQGGSNDFTVDHIKIEKVNAPTAADQLLLEWDRNDDPEELPPPPYEGYIKADPYIGIDLGDGLQNIHLASVNMESWVERATPLDNRIVNSGNSTFEVISNPFGDGKALKINYDFNGLTTFGGISLDGYFNESITVPEGALIEYDLYYPKSVAGKLMRFRIKVGSASNVDPYLRNLDTTNLNPDWQDYYMGETWLRNQTSVSAQAGSGNNFILELHGETGRPAEATTIIVANISILQPDPDGVPLPLIINTEHNSEVTPLKDKYNAANNFMVGAIGTGTVTGARENHYTIFVAGNSLKAEPTHPRGPNWLTDINGNALANASTEPGLAEYSMPTAEYKAVRDSGQPGEYKLHGHVLAWYNQAPAWMRQIVPATLQSGYTNSVNFYGLGNSVTTQVKVDADMAKRVQYNHTMYVMRHFLTTDAKYGSSAERGIIPFNSWDVLNEEVHESRYKSMIEKDPNSWRESLKHTNWLVAMSDDAIDGAINEHYIYLLFKYAHIAAPNAKMAEVYKAKYDSLPDYMKLDGHDTNGSIDAYVTDAPPKLTYNDYDTNNKAKARTVYNMVKELNKAWIIDPLYDGRPLIEDIGIQGHDSVGSTLATDNQYAVALYASLVDQGLLKGIAFSEFDLKYPTTAPGGGALAPARLNVKQSDSLGYQYALMYKMFTKFSAYIDHIISWGVQGEGWGSSYVLFDENGNANAGYYGAMDPDRYINGHSYLDYYYEGENAALARNYDIDLGDLGIYNVAKGGIVSGTATETPNSGSGSPGSSSGPSSPAPTPKPSEPVIATEKPVTGINVVSVDLDTKTDDKGVAAVKVTEELLNKMIDNVKQTEGEGKASVIEIKVVPSENASTVKVELPKEAFDTIANGTKASVKLDFKDSVITFDSKAINTISNAAEKGDIVIQASVVSNSSLPADVQQTVGDRPVFDFTVKVGDVPVSHFGGGKVSVAIPYTLRAGEKSNAVVVYYIDDKGSVKTVRGKYNAATKSVDFTVTHFSKYAVAYNLVNFADVPSGEWYSSSVEFIAARGITSGVSADRFAPMDSLTRGQFIVMLMKAYALDPDDVPSNNFTDAGNTYYTNYLSAAKRLGITSGIGDNKYAPDAKITRQEMYTMLYNALKTIDELPAVTGSGSGLVGYKDAANVDSWAAEAMSYMVNQGITTGTGNGTISPKNDTTRANMAQALYKLLTK